MRKISVMLVLLVMLFSCKGKADQKAGPQKELPPPFAPAFTGGTSEDLIKNSIVRYNELIAFGYRTLNMAPLQEVATRDQAEKAYTHMAALGEGMVRMISQMKKIDFSSFSYQGKDRVIVKTRERWDFAYVDIKTGVQKEEQKDFVYLVSYTLELQNGRWTITDVAASSEEKEKEPPKPRVFKTDKFKGHPDGRSERVPESGF